MANPTSESLHAAKQHSQALCHGDQRELCDFSLGEAAINAAKGVSRQETEIPLKGDHHQKRAPIWSARDSFAALGRRWAPISMLGSSSLAELSSTLLIPIFAFQTAGSVRHSTLSLCQSGEGIARTPKRSPLQHRILFQRMPDPFRVARKCTQLNVIFRHCVTEIGPITSTIRSVVR